MTKSLQSAGTVFQVFNEIGIINQLVSAQFSRVLAPYLGQSEFSVLNHFVRVGDGTTPSRLARIFQLTKPSMTTILRKLQAKDYILITTSDEDRRRKIVTITEKGRAARQRGVEAVAPLAAIVEAGFDVERLREILPVLTQLREMLDQARNETDDLNR